MRHRRPASRRRCRPGRSRRADRSRSRDGLPDRRAAAAPQPFEFTGSGKRRGSLHVSDARALDVPDVEILAARVVPHRDEVQPFAVRRHAGIAFLHARRGERRGRRLRPCAVHASRPDQPIALEARIGLHEVHLAPVGRERRRRFVLIARDRRGRPDASEGGSGEQDLHAAAMASISSSHASS